MSKFSWEYRHYKLKNCISNPASPCTNANTLLFVAHKYITLNEMDKPKIAMLCMRRWDLLYRNGTPQPFHFQPINGILLAHIIQYFITNIECRVKYILNALKYINHVRYIERNVKTFVSHKNKFISVIRYAQLCGARGNLFSTPFLLRVPKSLHPFAVPLSSKQTHGLCPVLRAWTSIKHRSTHTNISSFIWCLFLLFIIFYKEIQLISTTVSIYSA